MNTDGFGDFFTRDVMSMVVYNGKLYAGNTNDETGSEVWAYDGADWNQANEDGFGIMSDVNTLAVYNSNLYAKTSEGRVWKYNSVTSWTQVNDDNFGDPSNEGAGGGTAVYNGNLYVGTRNLFFGSQVWEYNGADWIQVNVSGFNNNTNNEGHPRHGGL